MDRHRGDRYGGGDNYSGNDAGDGDGNYSQDSYHSLRPSRFSDGPSRLSDGPSRFSDGPSRYSGGPTGRYSDDGANPGGNYSRRSPRSYRGGGRRSFESPPPGSRGAGFRPMGGSDGGGFRPMDDRGGGFGPNYREPLPPLPHHSPLSGHKRRFDRGSPDHFEGSFAKLFVGSVPRTATEADICPVFEEHGNVIEVALIKDKRTGQQQGCCFIKYATLEEADRAIKALHNQHTLPGGVGPIQVRFADGERERLGAVEYKLFVGSLNKQATEKEVEEIFARYGRVEDVYLMRDDMKQSRGCGFVKYFHRDMALAAINALNGIYTMRGCDQPLTVRFADPKRPRPGESRGGPASGAPGFGPRFQVPGLRPPPSFGDSISDQIPPPAWHLMRSQDIGAPPSTDVSSFGRSSGLAVPLNQGGPMGGPSDVALPVLMGSTAKQNFSQPLHQGPPVNQQISPLQKPPLPPQHLQPSLQPYPQLASYSQAQTSYINQLQPPLAAGQMPFNQALTSQHSLGLSGHLSTSQPSLQQGLSSATALQAPLNINLQSQSLSLSSVTNVQQLPATGQHQVLKSHQQSPPQLAQMLSQQTQTLQASFQSSQQAFSQLQQQVQIMQPSHQGLSLQQSSQATKQQHFHSQWPGMAPQSIVTTAATTLPIDVPHTSTPTAAVVTQAVPVKHNWTEHTSPEGFKYYYNSVTRESQWEKPEELAVIVQQQSQPQQQHLQPKPSVQLPQSQSNPQVPPTQKLPQAQPLQFQAQPHHQQQQPSFSSLGLQAAHEWTWMNKPTGT